MFSKYIILKDGNIPIVFPREPLTHCEMSQNKGEVKSAGFCRFNIKNNQMNVVCFGSSSTLGICSNPLEDSKIIARRMLCNSKNMK